MSNAKILAAKELIEEQNYNLARELLKTVRNDPTALQWLNQLDQIAPQNYGNPFANAQHIPINSRPIQYDYKSISVGAGMLQNLDAMVDKKIKEMARRGWEFVEQKEKQGGFLPKGRVLQFRRPRR